MERTQATEEITKTKNATRKEESSLSQIMMHLKKNHFQLENVKSKQIK